MADDDKTRGSPERWARLRFSVIGPLLAAPPAKGELRAELVRLAAKVWRHPTTGEPVHFGLSTIERWYYAARAENDPVAALRRKLRADSGRQHALDGRLIELLRAQYASHPRWSYKLHRDNLAVLVEEQAGSGPLPSYSSIRRFMRTQGLLRQRRGRPGEDQTKRPLVSREVRSFEAAYVNGLWHLDFHHGSLPVLTARGEWATPILLAILDDRSRLVCHAQWYLQETAECLVHGLVQAFLKRGLPRALITDNGSAMIAAETTEGLARLGVTHETTLPYSPHQNGKQEVLWAQVEGRLMAMLEHQRDLTLALLNQATQAWVEMEYHQAIHSETAQKPLERWLDGPSVARDCPPVDLLRLAFTAQRWRSQRTSDGTVSVEGVRLEVPSRFRHLRRLRVAYAGWDLGHVWLVDERTGKELSRLFPLDKARNAEGVRKPQEAIESKDAVVGQTGMAPLLRKLMADYAATGLPPAYIPKDDKEDQ